MLAILILAAATVSQPIAMTRPRSVSGQVPAFPRIASPADAAQRRINRALGRLDAKVRAAARACFADSTNPTSWQRHIDMTMRGPAFLSYRVTDDVDCGGAHPSNSHSAMVYDLKSGQPVDWTKLLPARLTGRMALTQGSDAVSVVTLASPRLLALYNAGYDRALDPENKAVCAGATTVFGANGIPMIAWLDARARGLALQFDFNHAMQACSAAVIIPAATLSREGGSPRLINALQAAR